MRYDVQVYYVEEKVYSVIACDLVFSEALALKKSNNGYRFEDGEVKILYLVIPARAL